MVRGLTHTANIDTIDTMNTIGLCEHIMTQLAQLGHNTLKQNTMNTTGTQLG